MRVTVCEFPDAISETDHAWDHLARVLGAAPTDLLVLPELAGVDNFWKNPTFDLAVWRKAVERHAQLPAQLGRLPAQRILGTRAVETNNKRLNESFLWSAARGLVPGRSKAWLPQEEGGWEETWFDRGPPSVEALDDAGLRFAMLICSEIMVSPAPRRLGQDGVHLIAAPRATGGHRRWEIATQMAAISAGAFVASANRRGGNLAGGSWIIGPNGDELARTDAANPIVTIDINLEDADSAKRSYPRTLRDPAASAAPVS